MITEIINDLLKSDKWKTLTSAEINNGNCDEFADDVEQKAFLNDLDVNIVEDEQHGHFYVKHEGKYYDAETPQGVKKFTDLPFYIKLN